MPVAPTSPPSAPVFTATPGPNPVDGIAFVLILLALLALGLSSTVLTTVVLTPVVLRRRAAVLNHDHIAPPPATFRRSWLVGVSHAERGCSFWKMRDVSAAMPFIVGAAAAVAVNAFLGTLGARRTPVRPPATRVACARFVAAVATALMLQQRHHNGVWLYARRKLSLVRP